MVFMCLLVGCAYLKGKPAEKEAAKPAPAKEAQTVGSPVVQVPEAVHLFGKEFSEEVAHAFVVRNTGNAPLRIDKVYPD